MLLSEDDIRDLALNRKLICDCLVGLSRSEKFSSISQRGVGLIKILLDHEQRCTPGDRGRLDIQQIASMLQVDSADVPMTSDAQLMATFDSRNWEDLMQSFDMTFDGTFGGSVL